MKVRAFLGACLLGASVLTLAAAPVLAESLRVLSGSTRSPLSVPMNRAVVVESDQPFAEISIANPGIADITTLSDRSIYVLGKLPGRTTMTVLGPDGNLLSHVEVQVSPDIAEFKERLRQILPGEQIEVRTANDGIVLSGTVSSAAKLDRALELAQRYAPERVSNLLTVGGTQQVMLKVRFAEMQRSVSKNLSASLGIGSSGSDGYLRGVTNNTAGMTGIFDKTGLTLGSDSLGGIGAGFTIGEVGLGVILEALESKGMVRTLAEPNLTALSGQEAKFLAGGEYPIPVVTNDGVAIEYKPFGVEMVFVPRVVDGDLVNLEIRTAVSAIDTSVTMQSGGFSVNAFKRRDAQTTVEMRDGESFAIAGLLQDDFNDLNNQIPWLGDVPILGALFRSAAFERKQSELVIIVTPHLVTPTRGEALALPTDRVRLPSESDLFLFGRTAKPAGAAGEVARQDYSGSYGYVME
ncbi:type II and III secretion system protein family protein [Phaeovulum vinaykumarii]|uniref:Pilus assembly protein CpaC n=1 Tax=Phaeovulum vinaykumarii TaxID=407234 RepID=A0A1N7L2C3_9RHOB|nr:type II and III secretion system protein family protein [Phaeovulum vinaykumarii]SIS67937.1 pilus assembly protein CpaC [Phaeovulum vinaykumarii]SOC00461.1 pilus assembly protein CpaC [Phaeovulum vinaykumarii]